LKDSAPRPRLAPVLAFTGFYIALATAGALARGSLELPMYLGVMAVLVPALYAVHRRYPLTAPLLWTFSGWGLLHMAGGLLPIPDGWSREGPHSLLYSWWLIPGWLRYDQVVHAYGFGITTWLCWHILKTALRSPDGSPVRPTPGILLLCVAGGMGFGAFNEMVEFIATRLLPDTNIGDYRNTGWDLVANFVGSLIAVALIRRGEISDFRKGFDRIE
jgi:uncharacterized membrane protein YjdF